MPKIVRAEEGLNLVGTPPDSRGVAPSGDRGVLKSTDSPYVGNDRIPGTGQMPNTTDFAAGEMADSHGYGDGADFEDGELIIVQGEENFDQPDDDVGGMNLVEWLALGRRCFDAGRTYYESGWRTQHIENSYLFKSVHSPSSKYCDPVYRLRSKIFRPLTRTGARSWEADVVAALFMNDDYMTVTPQIKDDRNADAASVVMEMMNLRLDKEWYQVCVGAAQDTYINGPVIAKAYWVQDVATVPTRKAIYDPLNPTVQIGEAMVPTKKVTKNEPTIDLILPENFLIDPTCSWKDPVGTAGYIIHRKQMSVDAVRRKMDSGEWLLHSQQEILSTRWALDDDATSRAKRGEGKPDPNDNDGADRSYETVMILEVIVNRDGLDYVYDMMGESFMLTVPVPLENRYAHGRRPFVMGTAMIESHNTMPDSKTQIGSQLQIAVNETSNNRMDNVRLAMNKRTLVKRGANIDVKGLTRSTPGGVVMTNNPESDVIPMDVSDVTASSYQETEQLTTELNEITGTFSAQAVANNRDMNETVGGMEMLSSAATKVVDYDIRTFVKTFVEPILTLYMLNIQYYEDEELIIKKALSQSEAFPRLQVEDLDDDLLTTQLMLTVDVGLGATNPQQRVNTLLMAVNSAAQLPGMAENLDGPAVAKRIFAMSGLGTGEQFFPNLAKNYQPPQAQEPAPDPLVLAAQEEAKGRVQAAQVAQEGENARHQADVDLKVQQLQMQLESQERMKTLELALNSEMSSKNIEATTWWKLLDNETKLNIAKAQDQTRRDTVAVQQGSQLRQDAINATQQIAEQPTSPQEQLNDKQTKG